MWVVHNTDLHYCESRVVLYDLILLYYYKGCDVSSLVDGHNHNPASQINTKDEMSSLLLRMLITLL